METDTASGSEKSYLSELRGWTEGFWKSVSPYVLVREEDGILILPPNRVYKLNGTALELLSFLSKGGDVLSIRGLDEKKAEEACSFFYTLKRVYEGEETELPRLPYDFTFTRLPILGELALTYRCNNRCLFCYASCGEGGNSGAAGKAGGYPAGRELSAREIERIIDIFKKDAKMPFFSFTGGEPLLRRDLERLIGYATKLGLRTNLITNGTLASLGRAEALKGAGLSSAQVSLESCEGRIHDELSGREGSFKESLEGIGNLQKAGIAVQTNTTVTRRNLESLFGLPAFLSSIGIRRFSMNLFIPAGRGRKNGELLVRYADIGPFVDRMRALAFAQGLSFLWYSPTPFCIYNPVAKGMGNKNCAAMDGLLHVNPAGEVLPCSSWAEPMGNILRQPFHDIWFSARAARFKEKRYAPFECASCGDFVACQSACPLYWEYAGTDEISSKEIRPWK